MSPPGLACLVSMSPEALTLRVAMPLRGPGVISGKVCPGTSLCGSHTVVEPDQRQNELLTILRVPVASGFVGLPQW